MKIPVMKDCLAWFELNVRECLSPGNHTLYIGEVVSAEVVSSGQPLTTLDYDRVYQGKN